MADKGLLIVVSGPSGVGKGTVLAEILKDENIFYSVSATTRNPREGEVDGVNYHFLTKEKFEELIADNGMLEYATYCDNYYGTPRKAVEDKLAEGKDVILEIEVQGAMNVKKSFPEAMMVFILPPSVSELRRRLNKRGTETEEVVNKRVAEAVGEIKKAENYDYVMINGDLDEAVETLKSIIIAEKQTIKRAGKIIGEVLENA
ncbi:MAG: guanylate kinase [Ruminococcus sp.]|nr:guanylate kinase [Ruminococcus sp.]